MTYTEAIAKYGEKELAKMDRIHNLNFARWCEDKYFRRTNLSFFDWKVERGLAERPLPPPPEREPITFTD